MSSLDADVIVVGGGPSGTAAAIELRKRGAKRVVLLEREACLGGATRHCSHSPFGMLEFGRVYFGSAYGRKLNQVAVKAGVDIRTGYSVVALEDDSTIAVTSNHGIERLTAKRVIVATGAREKPRSARLIPGDRPIGVVTTGTLQSFVAFHQLLPFRRPVIVGSELVSLSAVLTCLTHGVRPVAMIEPRSHAVARAPLSYLPALVGVPLYRNTDIGDIIGRDRVEAITIRRRGQLERLVCDGVLLTGQFTPESALFLQSPTGIDRGSAGPAVDQYGRSVNPRIFAAGNILRAVETGGWAYREGRAIARAVADDIEREPDAGKPVPITFDDPIKLVVPNILRKAPSRSMAFGHFQLRFVRRVRGHLSLELEGHEIWRAKGAWMPERRVLVPIPPQASQAQHVHFRFREE